MKYRVWTEYLWQGNWRKCGDATIVDSEHEAHTKAGLMIIDARKPIGNPHFMEPVKDVPRRYCIAEFNVIHTSEEH